VGDAAIWGSGTVTASDYCAWTVTNIRAGLIACMVTLSGGCAVSAFQQPEQFDARYLRKRAESVVEDSIRVSAAVPGREESAAIFGIDLSEKNVQPVWLEIENNSGRSVYFLKTGLDPEYFSPREVAFAFYGSLSEEGKKHLVEHIEGLHFRDPIDPHTTVSGFVFTNSDRETKFVSVDLLSPGWSTHLVLLTPIPEGSLTDNKIETILTMIAQATPLQVNDESGLRSLLEKLPCCSSDEHGVQSEPLNVVLIGELEATGAALTRRRFRYAPATSRYVFGRAQDLSLKKGNRWVAAQPHVLRVWLTNMRYREKLVWIGQISTTLGGRFAGTASDESPIVIEPDVDETRNDLVQDAIYSQQVSEIGFVKGVGSVTRSSPRTTPSGSTYHTDGLRAVMFFDRDPVSLSELEFISWERLIDHQH